MRIYKHNFKNDGKSQESMKWYCDVRTGGKRYRLPLFESKPQSQSFANKIGDLIAAKSGGETPGVALQEWVNQQSPKMQERFAQWGLISQARVAGRSDLSKHLDDWEAAIVATGTSKAQAYLVKQRAGRIFAEAGFRSLNDISPDKTMAVLGGLQTLQNHKNKRTGKVEMIPEAPASSLSKQHHLRAVKQFTKWATMAGRLSSNPLQYLALKNVRVENERRALSADELSYLLEYVQTAGESWNVPGSERALLYETAVRTGLRRDELKTLKRTSFDFKGLCVRIGAEHTKNKKAATIPVSAAMMDKIKQHLSSKMPTAPAFNVPQAASKMIRRDMAKARQQWIDAVKETPDEHESRNNSDFLKVETHAGKADFHALRHTFSSFLVASGTDINTAQALLRHATPAMTLQVYSHAQTDNLTAAIDNLPSFDDEVKQCSKKA